MAKNTLGYVELEWTCPNCGNKNPGMTKSCGKCGAPQPENVKFELGQNREMIKDAEKEKDAAKGADIHCPFCGTRNKADAQVCVQCGGDLKEGTRRESGKVIEGAPEPVSGPVMCPNCGTANPPSNVTCQACGASLAKTPVPAPVPAAAQPVKNSAFRPWMLLPGIAVLAVCCVLAGIFLFRTTALTGSVRSLHWERVIAIEGQVEVTHETWRDQLPADAQVLGCRQEYRSRQDSPAPGAREVCSTELVDQGNGSASVVETCYYEIYDDYCQYQALEWQVVDKVVADGSDLQPYWPQASPSQDQRTGRQTETYTVYFDTKDGVKEFTTSDGSLYAQFRPGTEWTLTVNTLGAIVDVAP